MPRWWEERLKKEPWLGGVTPGSRADVARRPAEALAKVGVEPTTWAKSDYPGLYGGIVNWPGQSANWAEVMARHIERISPGRVTSPALWNMMYQESLGAEPFRGQVPGGPIGQAAAAPTSWWDEMMNKYPWMKFLMPTTSPATTEGAWLPIAQPTARPRTSPWRQI